MKDRIVRLFSWHIIPSTLLFVITVFCVFLLHGSRWVTTLSTVYLTLTLIYRYMVKCGAYNIGDTERKQQITLVTVYGIEMIFCTVTMGLLVWEYAMFIPQVWKLFVVLAVLLIGAVATLVYTIKVLKTAN